MVKYLLMPGLVHSRTDGQNHYVNGKRLAQLYKVPMSECAVEGQLAPSEEAKLTPLTPRYSGDYTLPKEKKDVGSG